MKENLLSAIKAHDFTAIRNICFALSEQERNDLIHTLQTARWEQLYHNTDKRAPRLQRLDIVCFSYIFLCVSRTREELKKAVKGCYRSDKDIVAEFLQFYFPLLLDLLTTRTNPTLTGSTITVRAYDLPHHHTEETIIWKKQGHKVGALSLKAQSDFLEKWELQYLVPKLQLIANNIKNDKSIKISYSRIENVKKEKSKDWYISTVTPSPWKVNSEEWIDEVVLSIEIEISERNLMINSDISYGTGEIIKKDRFIIDNNTDNKDLDCWLEESASQVISLIKTINRNSD